MSDANAEGTQGCKAVQEAADSHVQARCEVTWSWSQTEGQWRSEVTKSAEPSLSHATGLDHVPVEPAVVDPRGGWQWVDAPSPWSSPTWASWRGSQDEWRWSSWKVEDTWRTGGWWWSDEPSSDGWWHDRHAYHDRPWEGHRQEGKKGNDDEFDPAELALLNAVETTQVEMRSATAFKVYRFFRKAMNATSDSFVSEEYDTPQERVVAFIVMWLEDAYSRVLQCFDSPKVLTPHAAADICTAICADTIILESALGAEEAEAALQAPPQSQALSALRRSYNSHFPLSRRLGPQNALD